MAGRILTLALPVLLLAVAAYAAWSLWTAIAGAEIGLHGVIALLLGVVFTLALTGGLLWLMRFSHRRGFDDR